MALSKFDGLVLPASFDAHVHLRDGAMMEAVVPSIRKGGVNTTYVMPNLIPPLTHPSQALAYLSRLRAVDSSVTFLPTLYLHSSITPAIVHEAKAAGIVGIKSYPAGVTTNSSSGVISYEPFYAVFAAMEECGMVLNLHGECPSDHKANPAITILNAESAFLPTLLSLHARFSDNLKICLEHCTTAEAIEAVRQCGKNVVGTITAHHLFLTIDDWADDAFAYCKPVAKLVSDRDALIRAIVRGNEDGKFFLGTDSAPHDVKAKKGGMGKTPAGVFTQPYATQLVMNALEEAIERGVIREDEVTGEVLKGFLGDYGRTFYGLKDESGEKIVLKKGGEVVMDMLTGDGVEVVPFRRGKNIWSVEWQKH